MTSIENYRDQVFELLTSLNSLDGLDRCGEEVEDSEGDDEGEGRNERYNHNIPYSGYISRV